jgi:Wadjet anti plasmid transformation system JetA-like protein
MPRRFTDAKALLGDLLDRHEAGAANPLGYPDYEAFADIVEQDRFVRQMRDAQGAGAVQIVLGRGSNSEQIKHIRLESPPALYRLLGRQPIDHIVSAASERLLDGLNLPTELHGAVASIQAVWSRGKSWQGFSSSDAEKLRLALLLAMAILEGRHRGVDYRTFSRRIAGESKALERLESVVVRILNPVLEFPPGARPRDALRAIGLEKFAPPLLVSGLVDFGQAEMSVAGPQYFGIPPNEAGRLVFRKAPQYLLTIENFASFNRHIVEADPQRLGVTLYVGGYPSLATQQGLRSLATALPAEVPLFHWSDIDPDGTWIFRTIERNVERPLKPHLMSVAIAEKFGRPPAELVRPAAGASGSAIADLVDYLQRDDAKWLEQEELDPVMPV